MVTIVLIIIGITVLYSLCRIATGHARDDFMSLDEVRETYFGSDEED